MLGILVVGRGGVLVYFGNQNNAETQLRVTNLAIALFAFGPLMAAVAARWVKVAVLFFQSRLFSLYYSLFPPQQHPKYSLRAHEE